MLTLFYFIYFETDFIYGLLKLLIQEILCLKYVRMIVKAL